MPFPTELFDEASSRLEAGMTGQALGFRTRLMKRERLQRHYDRGWDWLEARKPALDESNETLEAELIEHLQAERAADDKRYGFVPMFLFAIFLKIIASILIDLWLLHGEERA